MKSFSKSLQQNRTNTRLPGEHHVAHDLCFILHDVMTQLLVSGYNASAFTVTIKFRDDRDRKAFEEDDIFDWLEASRRVDERVAILVAIVFPAVLGDMLHCFYEALETSRKGKLSVSFMLIRKPLQESLFLLESIVADRHSFADRITSDPLQLRSQKAGGVEAHTKRIQRVLDVLGESQRFDAEYLARLRYDKEASDGFDGICNKAMHLFTEHKAIRTEPSNINFIFSGLDATLTQWSYLYSRLPYLLFYMHRVVEHICAEVAPTDPEYLRYWDRRLSALVLLWWDTLEPRHLDSHLRKFVLATRDWLFNHCTESGHRQPSRPDLMRMAETGAFPGEAPRTTKNRIKKFTRDAKASGAI
jgi:hypothetical protein